MDYISSDNTKSMVHYGVLGMKWGIRKDGKPQGFQYGKAGNRITKKQIDNGEPIVIAKGSTVYRTSDKKANFMKRKNAYVDITPNKHDHEAAMENMEFKGESITFTMKTKKPIKIATFDDYYKTVLELTAGTEWESDLKDLDIDEGLTFINRHIADGWLLATTPDNYKYQNFERINKRLSDKGFDGVLDPEDARQQYENQSLSDDDYHHETSEEIVSAIIFNPSDVLEIVNTEKPTGAPRGYYLNY